MPLSVTFTAQIQAQLDSALDLATGSIPLNKKILQSWATGVGLNQSDKIFHDQRTLTASATEDLDVAGVLLDGFGAAFTLARLKGLLVYAATANTNNVNVTRPAANGVPLFLAAGDGIPVKPNGVFMWMAPDATGIVVTAATGDLITITNSGAGTSVTYDVVIIGASA